MDIILLILACLFSFTLLTALIAIVKPFKSLKFKDRTDAAQAAAGCFSLLVLIFVTHLVFSDGQKNDQATSETASKSQEGIIEDNVVEVEPSKSTFRRGGAVNAIIEETKVVEALFPKYSTNSFWVSMFDDGSSRDGYAQYICLILREYGLPSNKLIVV